MKTTTEREPLPPAVPFTPENIDPTVAAIAAAGQLDAWIKGLLNPSTVNNTLGGVFTFPMGGLGSLGSPLGGGLASFFQQRLTTESTVQQVAAVLRALKG